MSEKEQKDLIKKRASLKGRLTTFGKYIEDLSGTLSQQQVHELQLRIGKLDYLFEQYDIVQTKLECLADDVSLQSAEREDFECIYYKSLSQGQELLSRNPISVPNNAPSIESCAQTGNHQLVKLPTINLPKYSGSYTNWLEFHDTFDSLIHSNEAISDINKFHYLRASLEGSAAVMIQEIQFSASNYTVAWQLLCERYHNKRLLVQTHVSNLFNIESIKSESSSNLKRLVDQLNKSLRALQSLGEPTTHWDTLLIHMMSRKLDHKTLREWEECKGRLDKEKPITLSIFLDFIRNRADLLETMLFTRSNLSHTQFQLPQPPKGQKVNALVSVAGAQPSAASGGSNASGSGIKSCPHCKGEHYLNNCGIFLGLSDEQRRELLPQFKVCYNCYRSNHYANRCRKPKRSTFRSTLSNSKRGINKPLPAPVADAVQPPTVTPSDHSLTLATYCADTPLDTRQDVLLSTALVNVVDSKGHKHIVRVLLDCASSSCIITEKMCRLLNAKYIDIDKPIFGINKTKTNTTKMCYVAISSRSENYSKRLLCYVLPSITDDVPCRAIDISHLNIPANIVLADPQFYKASEIDMIIGSDIFWDLLGSRKINLGANNPILWETRLGWLVSGPLSGHGSSPLTCNFTKLADITQDPGIGVDDTQNLLSRFWQLEEVSLKSSLSEEERKCEEHFAKNTTRLADGRFSVRIPLKQSADCLGESLQRAKRCLQALERRFEKQPDFRDRYALFMSEYLSLGHMSECKLNTDSVAYFIPHHGVLNANSTTTKLRVVFNASSPTTSGISLNQIQMVGPTVQDELLSILLRFRLHKFVLAADVEKMYRQVVVHPDDRHLQQILWRDSADAPLKVYQLNTVTYGCASASYLATRCLKQIGLECSDKRISEIIIHDFYVDDLLTGSDLFQEALDLKRKVTVELASAGMPLRKWKSNDPRLCVADDTCDGISSLNLNIGSLESCKTLGLGWQTATDELYFSVGSCEASPSTKRSMLSVIARIFDPMGLVSPCIVSIKILLQRLWVYKLSWDQELPCELAKIWANIIKCLPLLNNLRIPRHILCEAYISVDLHIFTDASQSAYGACLYARSVNANEQVKVSLLLAKSRVAPLKPTTIPRLELCGALVGVRLYEKVMDSLRVAVRHTIFWTDSTIVLGWLKMLPNKLQPFVRNRTVEIMEKTENCTWRHVPTDQNPADYISRGVDVAELQGLDLWWSGPPFLQQDSSQWPPSPVQSADPMLPEIRPEVSLHLSVPRGDMFIDFSRFSNLSRLKRAVAYALRFVNSCRKLPPKTVHLSSDELRNALNLIIRKAQSESFVEYKLLMQGHTLPLKSPLIKFNAFLDDDKIMRVGGRLENASEFSNEKKHPIILQSTHLLTKLIFKAEHIKLMHAGPQLLLASIREVYWPIGGRNLAKATYHNCIMCTRMRAKTITPLMGNLPEQRLTPGHPFECVGIDYAGPISSANRLGRGCKIVKVYIAIFVCFKTKAIHIELVGDLTSNSFLSALYRFISRRGKPTDIYSDNGKSFVGAYNQIGKFLNANCNSLSESVAEHGINFHFCPPYSPHFGGLWEAGVKSVKFHMYRVLGNSNLIYEELITVLTQIEAILNSRPLTPLSSDTDDLMPLTPGHFLIGKPLTSMPTPEYKDCQLSHLTRFQRLELMRRHFWTRWSKEYLSELQQRTKWRTNQASLKLNSLVVVKEDNLPPLKWKLGRIVAVYPGADGVSRVADIRTSSGIIKRSFSKICPLIAD